MSSVHLRMHCFLAIRMLHKKLGQNVSPQTIPQCSSTQPDPVPRRTLKWPFEYQDRISVPFSLRGRFVTSLPDEFYERASEASLRLAANKSPCGCYFHLRARRFLKKKKEKEKIIIIIIENRGLMDRLWSISRRSLLTGKTYAYLSDVCCSLTKLRK